MRHELAAEEAEGEHADEDGAERDEERALGRAEGQAEEGAVHAVERPHDDGILLLLLGRYEPAREDRCQRQGQHDRAADRERVRHRHRREDDAGHARHREEGEERHTDDERRERHRPGHLARGLQDSLGHRAFPVRPEVPEDVLHHDDGRVDDDPEVDGTQRDEVGRRVRPDQTAERDEERERDVERRDDGRARVPQEQEEDDRHEQHADDQVLQHRVRGQLHQVAAVVVRHDVHAGRQDVVLPDVVDALVDPDQRRLRLAPVAHEDDALHHVRDVVVPHDAEPRRVADGDVGDVPHARGDALRRADDDVLDVVHVAEKTDAADGVGLLTHDQPLAADVRVGGLDAGDERRELGALAAQAEGVDLHVVLLGLAAEADDVDDALHLLELAFEDPVLRGLEIARRVAAPLDRVAEHLADGVPGRDGRLHVRRELDEAEPVDDLLACLLVRRRPIEVALHVAEAEERLRPRVLQPLHPRQADLQRDGDVALDLLRAPPVRLRDHLDQRRHRVRVRLDVEPAVRREPGDEEAARSRQDDERHPQGEIDELLDHGSAARLVVAGRPIEDSRGERHAFREVGQGGTVRLRAVG